MTISQNELSDRLHRAQQMEETMALELLELCHLEQPLPGISENEWRKIRAGLATIQADTTRHQQIVAQLLKELEG